MIALIGHNGSGKSTLLKVLARQVTASGAVAFEGRALGDWCPRDYARRLAASGPRTTAPSPARWRNAASRPLRTAWSIPCRAANASGPGWR
ncbi:ATP-binding cassette domain-containing protein [Paracoccus shandongensis]|uniref:ATP-binding cassette domain-containing protein n=1 Tax=Paracoccus shandongensis TaxID=2816048 RepID=UPI003AF884A0